MALPITDVMQSLACLPPAGKIRLLRQNTTVLPMWRTSRHTASPAPLTRAILAQTHQRRNQTPMCSACAKTASQKSRSICKAKHRPRLTQVLRQPFQNLVGAAHFSEQTLEIAHRVVVQIFVGGGTGIFDHGHGIAAIGGFPRCGFDTHVGGHAGHKKRLAVQHTQQMINSCRCKRPY